MIVDSLVGTVVADTDGIEMAGDGLIEVYASLTIGLLYGAIAIATLIVAGEDTILAIDYGGHEIAVAVGVDHTLTIDYLLRLGREVVPHFGQHLLELCHLLELHGCSRIALYTTFALAGIKVADELLAKDVHAYNYIIYLYHININITNFRQTRGAQHQLRRPSSSILIT
jgi:hypothetical protein